MLTVRFKATPGPCPHCGGEYRVHRVSLRLDAPIVDGVAAAITEDVPLETVTLTCPNGHCCVI